MNPLSPRITPERVSLHRTTDALGGKLTPFRRTLRYPTGSTYS